MQYKAVICAGTFDHLHKGHKAFLLFAFSLGEKVYVTVTSDTYTAVHKPFVAPYVQRAAAIQEFLQEEGLLERAIIVPIDDVYGISLDVSLPIEALVVTEETLHGAQAVNEKRKAYGLPPLAIELAPVHNGETGLRISSTHIRTGHIGTSGEITVKNDFMHATLHLPEALREHLQKPFGKLVKPEEMHELASETCIAVGDVTTRVLHENGIRQQLSLVDFVIERQKKNETLEMLGFDGSEVVFHAENPPATLTPSLWQALEQAFVALRKGERGVVIVHGEEDLAVLPLLLLAPEGYHICYGQPHEGMVLVPVNQDTKEQALSLLSQFTKDTRGH